MSIREVDAGGSVKPPLTQREVRQKLIDLDARRVKVLAQISRTERRFFAMVNRWKKQRKQLAGLDRQRKLVREQQGARKGGVHESE